MAGRAYLERTLIGAALAAVAVPAAAHGEEVFFMPVGNLAALVTATIVAFRVKVGWSSRVLAVVVAIFASLPPYFARNEQVPYWAAFSGFAWFMVGFVPPVLFAVLVLFWRQRCRHDATVQRP